MRILAGILVVFSLLAAPADGRAEEGEWGVFIIGGAVFPNFSPEDPVAFDLAAGFLGFGGTYGLLDDLWLDARVSFTDYGGQTRERVQFRSQTLEGNLFFSSTQAHPTVGVQYNIFPGYDFSPYLVARGGFVFSTFRNVLFLNDNNEAFAGVDFDDSSEIQWTVTGGLSFEYRFYEFLLIGVEPTFTKTLNSGRNDWFFNATLKFTVLLGDG
ncbi:MAG: hypothetical protein AAFN74_02815 [Myxococcota bacterium]